MSRRTERLNDLFREEISDLLRRQIKDPRLNVFITVTHADVAPDLGHARIDVSVMGSDEEKEKALQGLEAAAAFIRHELRKRLSLRRMPRLYFRADDSIERAARVLHLLDEVTPPEEKPS